MAEQLPERLKVQVWIYAKQPHQPLQVLLLKLIPSRGGFWQPVTGGVEPGESPSQAALREATEETALAFTGAPESLNYSFQFEGERDGQRVRFTEHTFCIEVAATSGQRPATPTLDPREHVDFKWVTPDEAHTLLHFESNRETLRRFEARLNERK